MRMRLTENFLGIEKPFRSQERVCLDAKQVHAARRRPPRISGCPGQCAIVETLPAALPRRGGIL